MATFDKSAVDVAELSRAEVDRVVAALGLGAPAECAKLTNGGCAANYRKDYTKACARNAKSHQYAV